jgi:hypothetical protein
MVFVVRLIGACTHKSGSVIDVRFTPGATKLVRSSNDACQQPTSHLGKPSLSYPFADRLFIYPLYLSSIIIRYHVDWK